MTLRADEDSKYSAGVFRISTPSTLWRPQAHFAHDVTSAEQLDCLNDRGGIAVTFEKLTGAIHLAFSGSQSTTLSVWKTLTLQGFRSAPKLATDLITIRFVESGYMSRIERGELSTVVNFDHALLTSFDTMRYEQASPGFSSITAAVSREAIIRGCQALYGSDAVGLPDFHPITGTHSVGMKSLRQTLSLLCNQYVNCDDDVHDMMTPLLQDLLIYQIISAWPKAETPKADTMKEIGRHPVTLAMDYIEGNLRSRIEIAEIAAAAGVSVRNLQSAFKRRMGCGPIQYLLMRRLDRVHAALLSMNGQQIRQIAMDWGFVHMSDFNRRFRQRFGKTPREIMYESQLNCEPYN